MRRPRRRLVQRNGLAVDADGECAPRDDGPAHACRSRLLQQLPRALDVDAPHLVQQIRAAADAHLERQVQDRIHARAGGAHGRGIAHGSGHAVDVEPIEGLEIVRRELEHARANPPLVQPPCDVIAKKAARAGHENGTHLDSPDWRRCGTREMNSPRGRAILRRSTQWIPPVSPAPPSSEPAPPSSEPAPPLPEPAPPS